MIQISGGALTPSRLDNRQTSQPIFANEHPAMDARRACHARLLRGLRATPGVTSAALTNRWRMLLAGQVAAEVDTRAYVKPDDRPLV